MEVILREAALSVAVSLGPGKEYEEEIKRRLAVADHFLILILIPVT